MPAVYRAFLRRLGRRPLGLFVGSDLTDPERPEEYGEVLAEMLALNPEFVWPRHAHVVLTHQGYQLASGPALACYGTEVVAGQAVVWVGPTQLPGPRPPVQDVTFPMLDSETPSKKSVGLHSPDVSENREG